MLRVTEGAGFIASGRAVTMSEVVTRQATLLRVRPETGHSLSGLDDARHVLSAIGAPQPVLSDGLRVPFEVGLERMLAAAQPEATLRVA